jgi:hypothetical protein
MYPKVPTSPGLPPIMKVDPVTGNLSLVLSVPPMIPSFKPPTFLYNSRASSASIGFGAGGNRLGTQLFRDGSAIHGLLWIGINY